MSKPSPKAGSAKSGLAAQVDGASLVVRSGTGKVRSTYKFGGAVLRSDKSPKVSKETVALSHAAMRKLAGQLLKPGVHLPDRKGVPKFYVDEADSNLVIRELDGKSERGRFEDGQFKAVG